MTPIKKPWSKQTVEERVRNLLTHESLFLEMEDEVQSSQDK
jgi:hypothetical protein